ncbi:MAG: pirin [Bacteroidota bacterium]
MTGKSQARIYKSHQRGPTENENQRTLSTFNFEGYQNETRDTFGTLCVLNDETLAPKFELKRQVPQGMLTIIIPLVGGVEYSTDNGLFEALTGEAAFISGGSLSLKNPYESELINFLYLQFKSNTTAPPTSVINLDERNILHAFMANTGIHGAMGIFTGREEALYRLKNPENGLFVFIINGAFEVKGRLLEERDGLALWDTPEADMEALSENAIILILEVPLA